MLRLSKKADYALIALRHLAARHQDGTCSASEIAERYQVSAPLMAKVLQKLSRSGLLEARHGSGGGYLLARDPSGITVLDVIEVIDGPQFITSCGTHDGDCELTPTCTVREPLRRVNQGIMQVLNSVTISQMTDVPAASAVVELRT